MKRTVLRAAVGAVVLFVFMSIFYPLMTGQPIGNIPWLVISAITAGIVAPLADFLSRRSRRKPGRNGGNASGEAE